MPSVDYAFPAVDSATVNALATGGSLTADRKNALIADIKTAETNSFLQSLNTADSSSNNSLSYAVLLSRNKTIDDIASDMTTKNLQLQRGAKDTYIRQGQINEWQAQNKLDTLFFLQLTFVFFTILVLCMFLRRYGIISDGIFWTIAGIFTVILVGTLWNRAAYTNNSRDQTSWNRRYIGLSDSQLSKSSSCQ
jgi:hypothetical protein